MFCDFFLGCFEVFERVISGHWLLFLTIFTNKVIPKENLACSQHALQGVALKKLHWTSGEQKWKW